MSSETPTPTPLAHADFAPYEGQTFRIEGFDAGLLLASIRRPTVAGWPAHLRSPFTLIFHGPRRPVLPEALHLAQAPDGRQFSLHIMPIHTVALDRQDYQAVFN